MTRVHQDGTGNANEPSKMTRSHLSVYVHPAAQLYEFSTAFEIFCTKTAQCVYAQCVGHPPNTHRRGEPVTFLVVA